MKATRRKSRADALQILYQLELNRSLSVDKGLEYFTKFYSEQGKPIDDFTRRLVLGVVENRGAVDGLIEGVSEHWRSSRMPAVDRSLLRLGTFELKYCDDIPSTVTINEMVELSKSYGSESTPAFVNGVLDKLKGMLHNPNKAP